MKTKLIVFCLLACFTALTGPQSLFTQSDLRANIDSNGEPLLSKVLVPQLSIHDGVILPVFDADESVAFTSLKYYEENMGGMADQDDAWRFERGEDGNWLPGKNLGPPINTMGSDVVFWCAADGKSILVSGNYNKRGYRKAEGYALFRWDGSNWTGPEQIYIKNYINDGPTYMCALAPDGMTMIFSIMGPDSRGELDLYVSKRSTEFPGTWETPVSLGDVINTPDFDAYPHLCADGKTLFYTRYDGPGGFGNSDLYMTRRLDDTWQNWSEPVNLGLPVNTEGEDISPWMSLDGETLYYVSSSEGITQTGVYKTTLPQAWRPEPYAYLSGTLSSEDEGLTLEPAVHAYAVQANGTPQKVGHSYSSLPSGTYGMTLTLGREYLIEATAPGYEPQYTSIDLRTQKDIQRLKHNFVFERDNPSQEVLSVVYFGTADTVVGDDARIQLRKAVVPALNANGPMVEIVGHADDQGSEIDNLRLSMRRAKAVAQQLEELGVDYRRLTVRGLGESAPAKPGDDPDSRKSNRRVEIYLIYDGQTAEAEK